MAAPFAALAEADTQPVVLPGRQVLIATAAVFDVPVAMILSQRRDAPTATARQTVYFVLRERMGWTLPEIGRFMNRDHTTVLHGCRTAHQRLLTDLDFFVKVAEVLSRAGGPA